MLRRGQRYEVPIWKYPYSYVSTENDEINAAFLDGASHD